MTVLLEYINNLTQLLCISPTTFHFYAPRVDKLAAWSERIDTSLMKYTLTSDWICTDNKQL